MMVTPILRVTTNLFSGSYVYLGKVRYSVENKIHIDAMNLKMYGSPFLKLEHNVDRRK